MVDILLATYNGEKYLEEQVKSLINQTYKDIRILIRDDDSKDCTVRLIQDLEKRYPEKILYVRDNKKCGSAQANFMTLLKYASADYVMFCDQDDYWFPEKVQVMLDEIQRQEQDFPGPIIVYSDYILTDKVLKPRKKKRNSQVHKPKLDLNHLLVQNYINGCTMMINRSLYGNISDYRKEILMHDWWLAIYASVFGKIVHMETPLMYYRQHDGNAVGATDGTQLEYAWEKLASGRIKEISIGYQRQAKAFKEEYGEYMSLEKRSVIKKFAEIGEKNKITRMGILLFGGYMKSSILQKVGQLIYI